MTAGELTAWEARLREQEQAITQREQRAESMLNMAAKLASFSNRHDQHSFEIVDKLIVTTDRREIIADLISRREFEKSLNKIVDQERARQERLKNKRTLGGFNIREGSKGNLTAK